MITPEVFTAMDGAGEETVVVERPKHLTSHPKSKVLGKDNTEVKNVFTIKIPSWKLYQVLPHKDINAYLLRAVEWVTWDNACESCIVNRELLYKCKDCSNLGRLRTKTNNSSLSKMRLLFVWQAEILRIFFFGMTGGYLHGHRLLTNRMSLFIVLCCFNLLSCTWPPFIPMTWKVQRGFVPILILSQFFLHSCHDLASAPIFLSK